LKSRLSDHKMAISYNTTIIDIWKVSLRQIKRTNFTMKERMFVFIWSAKGISENQRERERGRSKRERDRGDKKLCRLREEERARERASERARERTRERASEREEEVRWRERGRSKRERERRRSKREREREK